MFAVEAAKIELNSKGLASVDMRLDALEKNLTSQLPALGLAHTLHPSAQQIADMAQHCVQRADFEVSEVTHLILVGGSSLMQVVQDTVSNTFPNAHVHYGAALTGIIEGLAQATTEWKP